MSAKKPDDEKIGSVPPFGLRMLPALKDKVEEAARSNGRSMNAEIVARLQQSFDATIETDAVKSSRVGAVLTLRIDAQGHPISWGEIFQHITAIRKAGKFKFDTLQAEVVNADMVGSTDREDQEYELMKHYRTVLRASKE